MVAGLILVLAIAPEQASVSSPAPSSEAVFLLPTPNPRALEGELLPATRPDSNMVEFMDPPSSVGPDVFLPTSGPAIPVVFMAGDAQPEPTPFMPIMP